MSTNFPSLSTDLQEIGICPTGFDFYRCPNFIGCCSVSACDVQGCPGDALPGGNVDATSTSKEGEDSTLWPPPTKTTSSSKTSPSTSSTDAAGTTDPLWPFATSTIESITDSTNPPFTTTPPSPPTSSGPTVLTSMNTDTSPSNNGNGEIHSISTAAIAGICVGATVVAMLTLLIAYLLVRRLCIARRMASLSASTTSPFTYDPRFAEKFMEDHPSWRRRDGTT
ncbi:hypothetical protein GGR54DRAFT_88073 [Hypoxylon sp. NC1633]|nr:hypothetical protein GGR54DRAFT_88073 [Hypoxylon sp. NC1633]